MLIWCYAGVGRRRSACQTRGIRVTAPKAADRTAARHSAEEERGEMWRVFEDERAGTDGARTEAEIGASPVLAGPGW